jgi:hypothetical protein
VTVTYDELEKLKKAITKLYDDWKKKGINAEVSESVENFSREKLTQKLADIFDEVYKKNAK